MKFYSFDPKKQKKILCGDLKDGTLYRDVSTKHFMRVVDGYGIQYQALQELKAQGVKYIVIQEKENGKAWRATLESWEANSKTADYGHGKQVFLSMKYMTAH